MGYIGHQFHFHAFALDLLFYRGIHTFADIIQILHGPGQVTVRLNLQFTGDRSVAHSLDLIDERSRILHQPFIFLHVIHLHIDHQNSTQNHQNHQDQKRYDLISAGQAKDQQTGSRQ